MTHFLLLRYYLNEGHFRVKSINKTIKKAHFNQAITFIDQIKNKNGKILVHCKAGVSRSATICLAYLISNSKKCLNDAYDEIKVNTHIFRKNYQIFSQNAVLFHQTSTLWGNYYRGRTNS